MESVLNQGGREREREVVHPPHPPPPPPRLPGCGKAPQWVLPSPVHFLCCRNFWNQQPSWGEESRATLLPAEGGEKKRAIEQAIKGRGMHGTRARASLRASRRAARGAGNKAQKHTNGGVCSAGWWDEELSPPPGAALSPATQFSSSVLISVQ